MGHLKSLNLADKHNISSTYDMYKKNTSNPVSLQRYKQIIADYNKFMLNKVIQGDEIRLPCKMGSLMIRGRKQTIRCSKEGRPLGLAPDWRNTKKLWESDPDAKKRKQLVYYMNDHTDNIRYKFYWSKNTVFLENKMLYSLRMTKANKMSVFNSILEGKEYKVVD